MLCGWSVVVGVCGMGYGNYYCCFCMGKWVFCGCVVVFGFLLVVGGCYGGKFLGSFCWIMVGNVWVILDIWLIRVVV